MEFVFGIRNLGNTCFFNALFQTLISSKLFVQANIQHGKETSAVRYLVYKISKGQGIDYMYYKRLIEICYNRFGGQEDSDEYFVKIVNALNPKIQDLFKLTITNTYKCTNCEFNVTNNEESFYWHASDNTADDSIIAAQLTTADCEKCGPGKLNTTMEITKFPTLLYIVMGAKKNYNLPKILRNYTLIGYVIHVPGHYYCYAQRGDKVYEFNDSSVSESRFETPVRARIALYSLTSLA